VSLGWGWFVAVVSKECVVLSMVMRDSRVSKRIVGF
jgi:hypothetical protein